MAEIHRYAAFTTTPKGGNPAGVVLDARDLDEARMQQIAAEVGYSETAFAVPTGPRRFTLRFFSPLAEVAFCGHATIATAVALAERTAVGDLLFDTRAGEIAVSTSADETGAVRAGLRSVPTTSRAATEAEVRDALKALRWNAEELDSAFPPHVAFGGNEHLVLAVRDRERLAELKYDFDALKALMRERDWTTLQLVWREDDGIFHSRNPFPVGGVVEDPATGAAAAAFGGYLRALGRVTEPLRLAIVQGEDMGRRSEITAHVDPDDPRVTVTGGAVPIRG
ncbi:PhzF family phenazine biosynthesis isomerase [Saccharopolyspora sp. TS4A08]|uniref:PhzF family phenazine biosynthesis isomerase n=1 Tax=Saccharopolyspora ipomoeae TaxID=3042027 RepID=A0ABT6PVQ9_9PSEU|nr:PhzF family phenazine biosynthesis isomerase [Saccharopolyspora sp. TS4A08]MDI2032098.1 PhzF family phenazine biosynthesis isomerase [Saccharopolyspora sp. TS4A08]